MQPNESDNTHSKKPTMIIIAIVVLVIAISIASALVIRSNMGTHPNNATQSQADIKSQAQAQYNTAQAALKNGDFATAKKAFLQARDLFKKINDTTHRKDIDSQLATIASAEAQTKPAQAPAATEILR